MIDFGGRSVAAEKNVYSHWLLSVAVKVRGERGVREEKVCVG